MSYKYQKKQFFIIISILIIISVILYYVFWRYRIEKFNNNDNITVVSGYWNVNSKFDHNKYDEWFKNTLNINQRYIFFCDNKDVEYIKKFRNNYETVFIERSLDDLYSKKFATENWVHPMNTPSKELGMIWHEKINLLKIAKDYDEKNNNSTDFYIWIDAGICSYRNKIPPQNRLNLKDVNSLPHDKIIYSGFIDTAGKGKTAGKEVMAGGDFMIHKSLIDLIHDLYYKKLIECNEIHNNDNCGVDQIIFTDLKDMNPNLFYKIGDDYGKTIIKLYEEYV